MKKLILVIMMMVFAGVLLTGCGEGNTVSESNGDSATGTGEESTDSDAAEDEVENADADVVENEAEVRIYLVRHGKTWFNTTGQVQGFSDSPLTETGIEQAILVGENMKDIKFTTAYSSSLGRQKSTTKYILAENSHEVPDIVEVDGLKEWNYGGYEGKTNEEMWQPIFEQNGLELDEEWSQYAQLVEILGDGGIADAIASNDTENMAETYEEITTRAKTAMEQITKETLAAGGGNVLAVSSGGQIPTILETIVPGQYQGEAIGNCTVTILTYKNGEYTLEIAGDESYLAE